MFTKTSTTFFSFLQRLYNRIFLQASAQKKFDLYLKVITDEKLDTLGVQSWLKGKN